MINIRCSSTSPTAFTGSAGVACAIGTVRAGVASANDWVRVPAWTLPAGLLSGATQALTASAIKPVKMRRGAVAPADGAVVIWCLRSNKPDRTIDEQLLIKGLRQS